MPDERSIDVSYVIPAFNAAEHVVEAVRSALEQVDVTVEVIVVDDASSDATAQVIRDLTNGERSVRLISLTENGGPSRARNVGIDAANGRWIGILDADDTLERERTRHLLNLAETTGAQIVADNLLRVDSEGRWEAPAFAEGREPYWFTIDLLTYINENTMMKSEFTTGYLQPIIRADILARDSKGGESMGIRYDEKVRVGEDLLLGLEILLAGGVYVVSSRVGYRYNVRNGSLSHRIGPAKVDDLRAGLNRLRDRAADQMTPEIIKALDRNEAAMVRARTYFALLEEAKTGRLYSAAWKTMLKPEIWPLIARFGLSALAKRVGLKQQGR